MQNAKQYLFIIAISLLVGFSISYAWNNKTIEQQLEEQNTAILQDCLSKARMKQVPSEILEATSHCNKDLLKTIYSPSYSWTVKVLKEDIITKEEQDCIKNTPDRWSEDPEMILEIRKCNDKYWTASTTPVSSVPIWFQLIPTAEAKSVENVKEKSQTGNIKVSTTLSTIWGMNTWTVRSPEQIYEQVKHLGYRKEPAISLISTCKVSSHDPRHCIIVWLTLMYNEAGNQQNSKACIDRNNCFGIQSWKKVYSSLDEWMENFVQKYNKYWYKADWAWFFYSSAWKVSKSRYCTSEDSSWSSVGCPHWLSIASKQWEKLYKIIY